MRSDLSTKYNVAVPRYTSYPTVPDWLLENPSPQLWLGELVNQYTASPGLSLYVHLPYCESLCTYCGCNKRITKNHQVEESYIEALIQEWGIYLNHLPHKPIIKEIHLGGGTPSFFSPKNLDYLLESIFNTVEKHRDFKGSFEVHPNNTTIEHLETLYSRGIKRLSIGVQDVSEKVLKAINRFQTTEEIEKLCTAARNIGYESINFDIIYGLPFQNAFHIIDTVQFINKMLPERIAFYSYAHVPWKSPSQRAYTTDDIAKGANKKRLYNIGKALLEEAGYKAIGMDHFCLEHDDLYKSYQLGKMHRNFMGYTSNHTSCSIGIGASSISDSWNMYVQSEKNIEQYKASIKEGKLPLVKGHILSENEQIIRSHILDLMCKNKTNWSSILKQKFDILPFQKKLNILETDGLISKNDHNLMVTDEGRFFIRNICSAIDPIFQQNHISTNRFSKAI